MKKQKTKKQAKKTNFITFLVVLIIGVACLVAGFVLDILIVGALFGGCFILAAPYVWFLGNKAIKHSYCPHCETKYDYNHDISWDEEEAYETDTREYSVVEFTCTCPKCKEEYVFKQKFTTAVYDKQKGSWKEFNLQQLVKKHFVK